MPTNTIDQAAETADLSRHILGELRDQIEDATNVVHLLTEIASSGLTFGERSRAALTDIGMNAANSLSSANAALGRHGGSSQA